jgi:hypothetical protein
MNYPALKGGVLNPTTNKKPERDAPSWETIGVKEIL